MKNLAFAAVMAGLMTAEAAMTAKTAWNQRWPWDTKVDIDFELSGGTKADVEVTASFKTNGVPVTLDLFGAGLVGDVFECAATRHRLTWDPAACGFDVKTLTDFSVTVTPVENAATARAWLVLDLEQGTHRFVALGDEPKAADGRPWQDSSYRTRHMVFRRIPAGRKTIGYTEAESQYLHGFDGGTRMMLGRHDVELTSDYYIAIYTTTAGQAVRIAGSASDIDNFKDYDYSITSTFPNRGYPCFQRGSNAVEQINWPATKFRVTATSHVGKTRAKFGNRFMIDLPTSAQWQAAARPDPQWLWYETPQYGGGKVGDSFETVSNVVNAISRGHRASVGGRGTWDEPRPGGLYQPNAYGLYDVAVARTELMLDAWKNVTAYAAETVDPVGPFEASPNRLTHNNMTQYVLSHFDFAALAGFGTIGNDQKVNPNSEDAYRYVIHLRPPQSFGGVWE